jgi:hypothetical protein
MLVVDSPHPEYGVGCCFFLREIYTMDTETTTSGRVEVADVRAMLEQEYGLFHLQQKVHTYHRKLQKKEWKEKLQHKCMAYLMGSDLKGKSLVPHFLYIAKINK